MQICYYYNDFDTFWPELTNRNDAHSLVVKDDNKQLPPLRKGLVRTLTCALNWANAQARKLDKYKYTNTHVAAGWYLNIFTHHQRCIEILSTL